MLCDVVREGTSDLIGRLRELGVERDGSIMLEKVDTTLSAAATRAEKRVPGLGVDAVVWEEVEQTTAAESELSWAFLTFMVVATAIAGIGVLLDQPILIVGATWFVLRLRFVRRASAAQQFIDAAPDLDLFALRAMANQPMPRLAKISDDPAGAWRRGELDVIHALALLELKDSGLRPPPPATA